MTGGGGGGGGGGRDGCCCSVTAAAGVAAAAATTPPVAAAAVQALLMPVILAGASDLGKTQGIPSQGNGFKTRFRSCYTRTPRTKADFLLTASIKPCQEWNDPNEQAASTHHQR